MQINSGDFVFETLEDLKLLIEVYENQAFQLMRKVVAQEAYIKQQDIEIERLLNSISLQEGILPQKEDT